MYWGNILRYGSNGVPRAAAVGGGVWDHALQTLANGRKHPFCKICSHYLIHVSYGKKQRILQLLKKFMFCNKQFTYNPLPPMSSVSFLDSFRGPCFRKVGGVRTPYSPLAMPLYGSMFLFHRRSTGMQLSYNALQAKLEIRI